MHATKDPLRAATVQSQISIAGGAALEKTGNHPVLDYITVQLALVPRMTQGQSVTNLNTTPVAEGTDVLRFSWQQPGQAIAFALQAEVFSSARQSRLQQRVSFPYTNIPPEIATYVESTAHIDSTPKIKSTAAAIATSDDAFIVVGSIASWIHESISYNLSTLTSDVVQPSSWVFENRYGVCDEITSLFISMLRSVGIPARYVSGVAYTNLDTFGKQWVNHAWAEVYFPGYGWVPYDITYGEYGRLDAAHIVLYYGQDSQYSSASYEYQAKDASLKTDELQIAVIVTNSSGEDASPLSYDLSLWKTHVTSGSWNVLTVAITNPTAYYVMETLNIGQTEKLLLPEKPVLVMLKPHETVRKSFLVKVGDLDAAYIYTFPINIRDSRNASVHTTFQASPQGEYVSEEVARAFTDNAAPVQLDADLLCLSDSNISYVGEPVAIRCTLSADINESVTYCLGENCQTVAHQGRSTATFSFVGEEGATTLVVVAKSASLNRKAFIPLVTSKLPDLTIADVAYPENITYDGNGRLQFTLKYASLSAPQNIQVTVIGGLMNESWSFETLQQQQQITLAFKGRHLTKKETPLSITATYEDTKHRTYTTRKAITLRLGKLSFGERMELSLNAFGRWVAGIF